MKNKTNEANNYKCVLCETGEGDKHGLQCSEKTTYINPSEIEKWKIMSFIDSISKTKAYIKEQKESGEDLDSEYDMGYDSALDALREFVENYRDAYRKN